MEFKLRPVEEKDIQPLADLLFYMWHDFYKDIIPKKFSDEHFSIKECSNIQSEMIQACKTNPKEHAAWVAEDFNQNIAALCYISINESDGYYQDIQGYETELQRLYVWPQYRGQHLGSRLFALSKEWALKNDYHSIYIWTFDDNPYGQFYQKYNPEIIERLNHDYEGRKVNLTVLGLKL